ncbi:MAG: hypothetical protein AAF330_00205 [Pseudomonadota bacterium]
MPLTQFEGESALMATCCDLLEEIADDLPQATLPVWREALQLSMTVMPRHLDAVIHGLIPALMQRARGDALCEALLSQLKADYEETFAHLPELLDLLEHVLSAAHPKVSADALGFALRSFFEAIRRQMSWENEVLIPLATRRLTETDRQSLLRALA